MALEIPDGWGLSGKVAIVTGGGAAGDGIGNGRAAAILLARAGTKVVVVDRDITGHTLVVDGGTSLSAPARNAGGVGG